MRSFAAAVLGCCFASANLVSFTFRYTADPAPLVLGSSVYLYTTHDATNQSSYDMYDYSLMSSTDLVNWFDHGIVFDARNATWGERGAWAQQTIGPLDGGDGAGGTCAGCYYMYWPNVVDSSLHGGVGVAISRSPVGPFEDVTPGGVPLMPGDDPTVYRDAASGAVFLCSNHYFTPICGRLAGDPLSWADPPINISGLPHWFEAPWLMQSPSALSGGDENATALLMSYECPSSREPPNSTFPLGHYGLDICQAVCVGTACPLDTWTFLSEAQLMWSPPESAGNNHGGLFSLGGRWYYAYHTGALAMARGVADPSLQRNVAVDAAYPVAAGSSVGAFLPVMATPDWLQQLSWVNPFAAGGVPGVLSAGASEGVDSIALDQAAQRVAHLPPGAWLRIAGVDFGIGGVNAIQGGGLSMRGSGLSLAVVVEVILDALDAAPVATCSLGTALSTVSCNSSSSSGGALSSLAGVHDVYLVAGGTAALVEAWYASGGSADSPPPAPPTIVCAGVRARGTGLLLAAPSEPADPVLASAATEGSATAWKLVDNRDGSWAMQAVATNTFLCVPPGGGAATCAATLPTDACARLYPQPTHDAANATTWALYPAAQGTGGQDRGSLAIVASAANFTLSLGVSDPRLAPKDAARFDLNCTARRF